MTMRDLDDTRVGHARAIGDPPADPGARVARSFVRAQVRLAAAVREVDEASAALVSATSEARTTAHEKFVRDGAADPSSEVNA